MAEAIEGEHIKVVVRFRPKEAYEDAATREFVSLEELPVLGTQTDALDVYDKEDTTAVYDKACENIVRDAMHGIHGAIVAYGQTGTGKTHTMTQVSQLAARDVFAQVHAQAAQREFLLRVSCVEIYNEVVYDLLAPHDKSDQERVRLKHINTSPSGVVTIPDATEEFVRRGIMLMRTCDARCIEDVEALLEHAHAARQVASTLMNHASSRSHVIYRIMIESRANSATLSPGAPHDDEAGSVRVSCLHLVDLAGSERAAHSGAEGQRLEEASFINKSLLTLGIVINKLSGSDGGGHVPYRDSKLTRILQPALGGNARTAVICTATFLRRHMEETISTLRFAGRASRVTNNAKINESFDDKASLLVVLMSSVDDKPSLDAPF